MKNIALVILLAGCTTAATSPPLPAPAQDTCNANAFAYLIGQPATALERVLLLGKVRIIRPNQPVTMDFLADRINFGIDETGKIAAITCG